MVKNLPANVEFDPWVQKTPWSRKWQPTLVFLPGKFHRQEPGGLRSMGSMGSMGSSRVGHN